jgi:uncharacterized protein (DUF2252 family)
MLASPFAFYRGAATIMASDLADTPTTGLIVQACGDAHLSNFGGYGTPERNLVFDLNDFDETLPAPWEWDVKRLAASVHIAARTNGYRPSDCAGATSAAVRSYRERMLSFATMTQLGVWYSRVNAEDVIAAVPKAVQKTVAQTAQKARRVDSLQALEKMTEVVDGSVRIREDPPLIVRFREEEFFEPLRTFARTFVSSIRDDLRALLKRYTFVDFALKVVGVGSVGTRCFVVLLQGNSAADPLFIQIKEAVPSVLEPYAGKSQYGNHGERVVRGQQFIQAASDIFLGWGRVNGRDFYTRQLRDMKTSVDVASLTPDRMNLYAGLCGWALARAHARSGDPAMISGYMGSSDTFDKAIVAFAQAYADQNERDFESLRSAVSSGAVKAETLS